MSRREGTSVGDAEMAHTRLPVGFQAGATMRLELRGSGSACPEARKFRDDESQPTSPGGVQGLEGFEPLPTMPDDGRSAASEREREGVAGVTLHVSFGKVLGQYLRRPGLLKGWGLCS